MTIAAEQAAAGAPEPEGTGSGERWIDPAENVLPQLLDWQRQGLRTALATLVAIDGSFPRALGAQMAMAQDGSAAGYISGGCLEGALIAEARNAMHERKNRLVRYGKGSKYFDIVLPCGSGVDVYFDTSLPSALIAGILTELTTRRPAVLKTGLADGRSALVTCDPAGGELLRTERRDNVFARAYWPGLRLVIAGAGPSVTILARLARTAGMQVEILTPEAGLIEEAARHGFSARRLASGCEPALKLDAWTAGVLLFHDHGWELPLLPVFLESECFYLGAVGGGGAREARQRALAGMGADAAAATMLRTPAGMIPHAKQPAELAVSILAEIVAAAKEQRAG